MRGKNGVSGSKGGAAKGGSRGAAGTTRPRLRVRRSSLRGAESQAGAAAQANSLRAIFLRRMREWARDLAENAPVSVLAEALAKPSARGSMVHVLTAVDSTAEESEVRRLRDRALVRAAAVRQELRAAAGGFRSTAWVADHLGIRRQAVDKRRREGSLLALETPHGYEFPACQFTEDSVVPGLKAVLSAMRGGSFWETLAGLVTPAPALGGRTVIGALQAARTEDERHDVAALAGAYAGG